MHRKLVPLFVATLAVTLSMREPAAIAEDWPMWRADAGHTASTSEKLPDELHQQWVLTFSQRKRVWDDPLNHDLMSYDRIFEPIIANQLLYLGFSDKDKLAAYDLETGAEKWSFYADAPIRFAPVAWEKKIYVSSDDGYLYCLNGEDGTQLWKFQGAPDDRKVLGNGRVISAWPARGGPVLRDGTIYFAASIWPFMGTFIYALDAETGSVVWVNDGTGADYIKQPHSTPSFAGVAPQGTLVALDDHLLVPGGRSVPAAFDRKTGAFLHFHLDEGGKGNGGSLVLGKGDEFYVHTRDRGVRAYGLKDGKKTGFEVSEPVLSNGLIFTSMNQPDLKTRLEAAEASRASAAGELDKAKKALEDAKKAKDSPLTDETKALEDAKAELAETEAILAAWTEADESLTKAEAEAHVEEAKRGLERAQKSLDEATKKTKEEIDKKLYENIVKADDEYKKKDEAYQPLKKEWDTRGRDVKVVQAYNAKKELVWEFEADATGDLIQAGDRLYAAGPEEIVAIDHPGDSEKAKISWRTPANGEVLRLLAGNGRLVAVTLDGRIICYGEDSTSHPLMPPTQGYASKDWPFSVPDDNRLARQILAIANVSAGYALCFGVDDGRFIEALTEESELHWTAIDRQAETVNALRRKFDYMKVYGERVTLHQGDADSFQAPPYIASIIVLGNDTASRLNDPATIKQIYESVRPYGGAIWFPANQPLRDRFAKLALPQAEIVPGPAGSTFIFRQGPLPGSSDWTHQYGSLANTVKSDDKLVKLPLGVLWFGGSSNTDVLPRHGHGPPEQVIGGRTIIEGMNCLSARDVYTGRILWKRDFENLGTYGIYYDNTYKETPLSTEYNQVHIPGATGRGTNYVATEDRIYVAIGSACHVLDPDTGQDIQIIELPTKADGKTPTWAFIGVKGDLLIGGNDFAHYTPRLGLNRDRKGNERQRRRKDMRDVPAIEDLSASHGLIAFNRYTGEQVWEIESEFSFLHNGIVAGNDRFYLLDKLPASIEERMKRRGQANPEDYRILAIDQKTGQKIWENRGKEIFGTWLGYSEPHDILLQSGSKARDRMKDEVGEGMITYRGASGEKIWERKDLAYTGPPIIHNDRIITSPGQYYDSSGALNLADGTAHLVLNPLTGKQEQLRITRAYGCNTPIAGEFLMTFRSGAAGFYDLEGLGGTGNFGGFKSGCTSNLIPANGLLNAPDYTRTCSCGYQNQTSLALVHMPDLDLWTLNRFGADSPNTEDVRHVGINFGAPGDRREKGGTLWLEHPSVGGDSPEVSVTIKGEKPEFFRRHSSQVKTQSGLPWVGASGVRNATHITVTPRMNFQQRHGNDAVTTLIFESSDDAEEGADGTVDLTSTDLELTQDEGQQVVGLRFRDIQAFPGDRITNAYVQFTVDETGDKDDPEQTLHVSAELTGHAQPFSAEAKNLSSRKKSEKPVEWKVKPWEKKDEDGERQRTANLAPLIQELIDREDWSFGNDVALFITGEGKRVAFSADGDPKKAPRLVVETDGRMPRIHVAGKDDDAEEGPDQEVSVDSGDLELIRDEKKDQLIGIRFNNLKIPRGQRLDAAHLQFTVDEPSDEPTQLTIHVEDTMDSAGFKKEKRNISSRKVSEKSVTWEPAAWTHAGLARQDQRSPDLVDLIQPIFESEEWYPGQGISFIISGSGKRIATAFDDKKKWAAPKLVLLYNEEEVIPSIEEAPRFTVKLYFLDPDLLEPGKRLFNIALQGERVLENFDIATRAHTDDRLVIEEFTGIPIPRDLEIALEPVGEGTELPVISGIELIAESPESASN